MSDSIWNVYIHINKINNKKYVGITMLEPEKRWGKNGIHYKNQPFYRAIKKYGWDNFKHIVLYRNFTEKQAKEKEKLLIKLFKTRFEENGYNMTDGGDGTVGCIPSKETLRKSSESHMGQIAWNKGMKGLYHSENISKSKLKQWQSVEYREMQRKAHLGNKQSEETKAKITKNNKRIKGLISFDIYGNDVKYYERIQYAVNEGYYRNCIRQCCKSDRLLYKDRYWFYSSEFSFDLLESIIDKFLF